MAVNIESIMQEIRQEIKDKGYTNDMLSFREIAAPPSVNDNALNISDLDANMNYLNNSYMIVSCRPLQGNGLFVFIKKVIRKLTKFYVEPIVSAQNEFNAFNVRVLNVLSAFAKKQSEVPDEKDTVSGLSERLSTLELQLKTAASEISALRERVNELESENKELKSNKTERT